MQTADGGAARAGFAQSASGQSPINRAININCYGASNQDMNKVSVVIPTYNRADVLPRAIESVINQTYNDYEIIVVDDGSKDKTQKIMESYESDKIKYIKHSTNRGQNSARNTGILNSSGYYISYLDSDDVFFPEHISTVIEKIESLPDDYGGVYTSREDVTEDGIRRREVHEGELTLERLFSSGSAYRHIAGSISLTFKKDIIDEVGLHDEDIIINTDLDFFIQLLKEYKLYGINEPLCRVFRQSNSESRNAKKRIKGGKLFLDKHGKMINKETRARQIYNIAMSYAAEGEMNRSVRFLLKSIRICPYQLAPYYHLPLCLLGYRLFNRFNRTVYTASR